MRNKYFRYGWLLSAAVLLAACSNEDDMTSEAPDTPTEGYRWTFGGGVGGDDAALGQKGSSTRAGYWEEKGESDANGNNKLAFAWDYNTSNEMVFAVTTPLIPDNCQFLAPNGSSNHHTYMEVLQHTDEEKADDDHWAIFKSMSSFATPQTELANHHVYAVTPIITEGTDANESTIESSAADEFYAVLNLPQGFYQPESGNPKFLHKYMYMSATATLDENGNVAGGLLFEHIPATFRFKVTNKSGEPMEVQSITVSTTNSEGIAPYIYGLHAKAGTEGFTTYDEFECHSSVVVHNNNPSEKLANNNTYTGYMLLFPGVEFADTDEIIITARIDGTDQTVLAITGEQLKAVTTSKKLLSGNLYTFNLKYEVGLSLTGITVSDWTEEVEVNAPIATEWVNGFSESGECQPAKLNDEGQYRIGNAGNLVWFANQVNSGNTGYNAVLTADIDMKGVEWVPIGSGSTTAYTGTFDGNGHSIKNIAIKAVGDNKETYAGLCGILGGTVQNLDVSGTLSLNSNGSTGGVAGELVDGGSIINVLSDIDITAVDGASIVSAYVGGVVGKLTKGSISRCTYAGDLKLGSVDIDQSGGIVGYVDYNNSNAKSITDCAFTGSISTDITDNSLGGIMGYSRSSALTLKYCLSVGTVSGPTGCTAAAFGTINAAPASISTLYYLEGSAPNGYYNSGEYTYITDEVKEATATELSNGTVATALGEEKWAQGTEYPELIRTIE